MKNIVRLALALVAACLAVSVAAPAQAQVFLDMTINPFGQIADAGTAQSWDVILTNNTGGDAIINLTAFAPGFPVTTDVDVMTGPLPTDPFSLADGQSLILNSFLTTTIHPFASSALYDALAEATYNATDADGNDFLDLTAAGDWRLTVRGATAAPEPAALLLLLTAPALVLALRSRRRIP